MYPLVSPVHALRPADIQVVAALGDSLTVRTLGPWVGGAALGVAVSVPGPSSPNPGSALLTAALSCSVNPRTWQWLVLEPLSHSGVQREISFRRELNYLREWRF